ncbi:hypothetical protein, partial [Streptomyces altiplanensis]
MTSSRAKRRPRYGTDAADAAGEADARDPARTDGQERKGPELDAVRRGDGLHLHAVGDDQPVVAEFLAQQT